MSISNEFADALVDDLRHKQAALEITSRNLAEMEAVLAWSSENVITAHYMPRKFWSVAFNKSKFTDAPTLYEALKKAWENREGK